MNATSSDTLHIVNQFYQKLAKQDIDGLTHLFSMKVDWYIPGEKHLAPWLGYRSNRTEIRDFFETLLVTIEPVSATIEHIFTAQHKAVVTGYFASRMLSTGKLYESFFTAHFTIEDHLIVKYRLYEDTLALVKSLT